MSKLKFNADPAGTGVFGIKAPDGNVDRELILPDSSGTLETKLSTVAAYELANGKISEDGSPYTDPDAIGANPTAKIYPDGSIVGSTDNGSYVKWANGEAYVTGSVVGSSTFFAAASIWRTSHTAQLTPLVLTKLDSVSATLITNSQFEIWLGSVIESTTLFRATALSFTDSSGAVYEISFEFKGRWKV